MISRHVLVCVEDTRTEIFDVPDLEYRLIDLRPDELWFFSVCVTLLYEREYAD